jgi:hypothetical protein
MNRFIWWKRDDNEKEVKHNDIEEEILLHSAILTIDNYTGQDEEKKHEEKKHEEKKREEKKQEERKREKKRDSTFTLCIDGIILYLERCKMNLS